LNTPAQLSSAYSLNEHQIIFTILSEDFGLFGLNAAWVGRGCFMIYKGVEFTVTAVAAGAWKWQFRIGDRLVTGKTETRLACREAGADAHRSRAEKSGC
jgi:hypothetical protein